MQMMFVNKTKKFQKWIKTYQAVKFKSIHLINDISLSNINLHQLFIQIVEYFPSF